MKHDLKNLLSVSIRDLLFVSVIAALCVAWWIDRSRLARQNEKSERQQVFSFYIGLTR
jgi:hypothetical protein